MESAQLEVVRERRRGRPKELNLFIDPTTIELRIESAMQFEDPEEGRVNPVSSELMEVAHTPGSARKPVERDPYKVMAESTSHRRSISNDSWQHPKTPLAPTPKTLMSSKSRKLAAQAEARFFSRHQIRSPKASANSTEADIEVESQNLWQMPANPQPAELNQRDYSPTLSNVTGLDFQQKEAVEGSALEGSGLLKARIQQYLGQSGSATGLKKDSKGSHRNLSAEVQYYLSRHQPLSGPLHVARRNADWNNQRKQKLSAKKASTEQSHLAECTFAPVIYTKVPHRLHRPEKHLKIETPRVQATSPALDLTDSLKAALTPKSQLSTASHTRVHSLANAPKPLRLGKQLSPVTYRIGMDFDRLLPK